jgi:hypothetical protein
MNNKLIKIYTGTEISVLALKDLLEKDGITTSIHNDSNNSFLGAVPAAIDLYIQSNDLKKAKIIIEDFTRN